MKNNKLTLTGKILLIVSNALLAISVALMMMPIATIYYNYEYDIWTDSYEYVEYSGVTTLFDESILPMLILIILLGTIALTVIYFCLGKKVFKNILFPLLLTSSLLTVIQGIIALDTYQYDGSYDAITALGSIAVNVVIVAFILGTIGHNILGENNYVAIQDTVAHNYVEKPQETVVQQKEPVKEKRSNVASNSKEQAYINLKRIKEMYDDGILTQEEFEEKKRQYLNDL